MSIIRGRKYQRREDIQDLASLNYFDTIIMLPRDNALRYEELVADHPNIRLFLFDPGFFSTGGSAGTLINLGIREARGEAVLTVWGDSRPSLSDASLRQISSDVLCYAPMLRKPGASVLPSLFIPAKSPGNDPDRPVEPIPVIPDGREQESLFPSDNMALYIKERFLRVGGYDESFRNSYWQRLEFGFRSRLWGEKILYLNGLRVDYLNDPAVEISTPDEDYLKFYLRIMAIRYTGDKATLPVKRFWHFYRAGTVGLLKAWERFSMQRRWVHKHRYHYRFDVRQLVELWGEQ